MAAGDERCIGYAVHQTFEPCQADVILLTARNSP